MNEQPKPTKEINLKELLEEKREELALITRIKDRLESRRSALIRESRALMMTDLEQANRLTDEAGNVAQQLLGLMNYERRLMDGSPVTREMHEFILGLENK